MASSTEASTDKDATVNAKCLAQGGMIGLRGGSNVEYIG